jgi:hypothetical protein
MIALSVFVAWLWSAQAAYSAVSIVVDPGPPIASTPLTVGDFQESETGTLERFQFSGTARNNSALTVQLHVSARADGAVVPGSEVTFALAPNASTGFTYDYTLSTHPSSVGLQFQASGGTVAFVGGLFQATPFNGAPALAVPGLLTAAAAIWFLGSLRLTQRARHASRRGHASQARAGFSRCIRSMTDALMHHVSARCQMVPRTVRGH